MGTRLEYLRSLLEALAAFAEDEGEDSTAMRALALFFWYLVLNDGSPTGASLVENV